MDCCQRKLLKIRLDLLVELTYVYICMYVQVSVVQNSKTLTYGIYPWKPRPLHYPRMSHLDRKKSQCSAHYASATDDNFSVLLHRTIRCCGWDTPFATLHILYEVAKKKTDRLVVEVHASAAPATLLQPAAAVPRKLANRSRYYYLPRNNSAVCSLSQLNSCYSFAAILLCKHQCKNGWKSPQGTRLSRLTLLSKSKG